VGKSYLLRGRFETLRELMMKVDQIRPQDILYAANTYLDTDRMSRLTFLPG
jgi:predicted Zn-dependent peptidase